MIDVETLPGKSTDNVPGEKSTEGNSYLIAVALSFLAIVILVVLVLLWFCFVHKPRSQGNCSIFNLPVA